MFADDNQIEVSSDNINLASNSLNEELVNVLNWMNANKLSLNSGKTEYMIIGSHKRIMKVDNDPLISLFNNSIQRVKVTKSIGLMIDEALTWIEKVNLRTSKVNTGFNALKRLRISVDPKILKLSN